MATGDLLHGWMPYMGDSFPPEWVATLDALGKLEFDHIIGGHGTVKPRAHLTFFRNYLADLDRGGPRSRERQGRDARPGQGLSRGGAHAQVRRRHERRVRRIGRREHREGLLGPGGEEVPGCRTTLGVLLTVALSVLTAASPQTPPVVGGAAGPGLLVFIGTYSSPASKGIYASRLDPSTGALSTPVLAAAARNPSFLAASGDGRFLYSRQRGRHPRRQARRWRDRLRHRQGGGDA